MTKNAAAFSMNDRIHHYLFGLGTILALNERHTTISFDENGTKKFLTSVVRLEHSSTPAPAKPPRSKKPKAAK